MLLNQTPEQAQSSKLFAFFYMLRCDADVSPDQYEKIINSAAKRGVISAALSGQLLEPASA